MNIVSTLNGCSIQYKAPSGKTVKVTKYKYSFCQERLAFGQFQIDFIIVEVQNVSVTADDNIHFVCISLEV